MTRMLAAGLGSRYGDLKQLEVVGPDPWLPTSSSPGPPIQAANAMTIDKYHAFAVSRGDAGCDTKRRFYFTHTKGPA